MTPLRDPLDKTQVLTPLMYHLAYPQRHTVDLARAPLDAALRRRLDAPRATSSTRIFFNHASMFAATHGASRAMVTGANAPTAHRMDRGQMRRRAAVIRAPRTHGASATDEGVTTRDDDRSGDAPGQQVGFLSPFGASTAVLEQARELEEKKTKRGGAREMIALKIDEEWYDCSGWAMAHPGGSTFVRLMHGHDATDLFYALHSYGPNGADEAIRRLKMLPKCAAPYDEETEETKRLTTANAEFGELRAQLEREGWFKRNVLSEISILVQVLGCYVVGQAVAATHPVFAALAIGVGMQQAGWLAHDYVHGRGKWCSFMRCFGALTNGFSAEWWSHKHNMHHSFTNVDGKDGDIKLEPLYFLSPPEESGRPDSPLRKYQHLYGYPLYAFTYILWRRHSVASAYARKDKKELALLGLHYAWLFGTLPLGVAIGSMLIGGFLVGSLVTATHQSEEIMFEDGQFVDQQFRSTREANVRNPVERWLWGGMDTQLIHHLFPTMPRYKLHKLRPIVQKWAEKHGYDFRISDSIDILKKNYRHLEGIAALEAI